MNFEKIRDPKALISEVKILLASKATHKDDGETYVSICVSAVAYFDDSNLKVELAALGATLEDNPNYPNFLDAVFLVNNDNKLVHSYIDLDALIRQASEDIDPSTDIYSDYFNGQVVDKVDVFVCNLDHYPLSDPAIAYLRERVKSIGASLRVDDKDVWATFIVDQSDGYEVVTVYTRPNLVNPSKACQDCDAATSILDRLCVECSELREEYNEPFSARSGKIKCSACKRAKHTLLSPDKCERHLRPIDTLSKWVKIQRTDYLQYSRGNGKDTVYVSKFFDSLYCGVTRYNSSGQEERLTSAFSSVNAAKLFATRWLAKNLEGK